MNVIEVNDKLKSDEQCVAYLEARRWPNGVRCVTCGGEKISRITSKSKKQAVRKLYQCLEPSCKQQFTATSGTLFHDSHLPLHKWFLAMAFMTQAKKGMSAKQLQAHLGLKSYQTAWYLCHRIRKAMAESGSASPLGGIVEVDETHVSGRYDKRRKRDPWATTIVAGMVERGGRVRTQKIHTASKQVLVGMVRDNVQPSATVMTDEATAYKSLGGIVAKHNFVRHSAEEWVRGNVHTNTIEGCWSLLKRGIVGSFHKISVKHLDRYLAEFDFRFNNRKNAEIFDALVTRLVARPAMPYRELTAQIDEPF
jgi:transposase-like protein